MFDRFRFKSKRLKLEEPETELPHETDRDSKRIKLETSAEQDQGQAAAEGAGHIAAAAAVETASFTPGKWQERWHGICDECFASGTKCMHHPERRLRLLIVGHNPSDHAWATGYSYSNPSNSMWKLLTGNLPPLIWDGILPMYARIQEQNTMPVVLGVGFTSIGLEPGNNAAHYDKAISETTCISGKWRIAVSLLMRRVTFVIIVQRWKKSFFQRLRTHSARVCINHHDQKSEVMTPCERPHGPMIIAFSGKRQFSWLFTPPLTKVDQYGKQNRLPPDWPHDCLRGCEVWVLPSSSGRAAMTKEQRSLPYQQLAERVREIPWPSAS